MKVNPKIESNRFLRIFIPLTVALAAAQYFIIGQLSKDTIFYFKTWQIYLFHALVTLFIFGALLGVAKASIERVGQAFMACSFLKILASIIFMLPLIKLEGHSKIPDVIAFFVPYFIYLAVETYFATRLMKDINDDDGSEE